MTSFEKLSVMKKRSANISKVFFGTILIALLIILIISSVNAVATNSGSGTNTNSNYIKQTNVDDSNNGYIIEFDDAPAFVTDSKSSTELLKNEIKTRVSNILKEHENFKNELSGILYNKSLTLLSNENKQLPITNEYTKIYNGMALKISKEEAEKLLNLPNVKRVVPNQVYHLNLDYTIDWLNVSRVWETDATDGSGKLTGKGVVVAMIDSGAEITHPMFGNDNNPEFKKCTDFANCAKVNDAWNFVANNAEPWDDNGHGTHTASTVAGINDGVLKGGMAPDAKLDIYKVCDSSGGCSESAIVSAIERAVDPNNDGNYNDHADIISMSLGGDGTPDCPSCKAIDNAADKGVISIVAAGNSGPSSNTIGCPACAAKAIAVAAACKPTDIGKDSQCMNGAIADFSSRGPVVFNGVNYNKPEITAPGVMICAAKASMFKSTKYPDCFDSNHVRLSGTSMATPHVAGIGALIVQEHPGITWSDFEKLIQSTATSLGNYDYNTQGAGLINPTKIFNLGSGSNPTDPTNPPVNNTNSTEPVPPTEPPTNSTNPVPPTEPPVNPPVNNTNSTNPVFPVPPTIPTNITKPIPPIWPPTNPTNPPVNPPTSPPGNGGGSGVPEDVNKDGKVDIQDVMLVLGSFGNQCNSPDWCQGTDINQDGAVDFIDLLSVLHAMK